MRAGKYVVIGGQYMQRYYGVANTLSKAKCLATQNVEFWDNWQDLHVPKIYAIEDCEQKEDGYFHKCGVYPVSTGVWARSRVKWEDSFVVPF